MSADPPPLLELRGVSKRFAGVTALDGVDFTLGRGEIHGLVGENGAGKSTLMKIIAGVYADYEGEMRLDGRPVRLRSPREARDAGIGMVHQELSIVPALSVAENVLLGRQPLNRLGMVSWRRMREQARAQLRELGIDLDPTVPAGSLPIGLQQMIELARVLLSGARIVILDEPTSALSPPEVERLFTLLERLRQSGRSVIFISHFLDDVLRISDNVTVFRNGRRVGTAPAREVGKGWLIERMIGGGHERLEESYTDARMLPPRPSTPAVLEAEGLGVAGLFEGASLRVHAGEVVGIYGFMGSGQLELARALSGKLPLDHGTVRVDGRPARLRGGTPAAKRAGIAFVPESRRAMLFAPEPVYRNISISILERISRLLLHPRREREIAEGHVRRLGVRPARVDLPVGQLSGGNQQKVALARWLTHLPRVLLLSEPTRGMDVGAKDDVVRIVRALREQGIGIVVVSSEPETVLALADRILVMRRGHLAQEFAGEAVGKDRLLEAA
ncbi:ATP-binding cassette domain-containing protein [Pseudoroseomonas wenyumeiae]|uniref:ATP-binding cassette domain-containing protein n=1 Tax=Teichococcus wenyumeiae TaxID=2478470 RepID=A0A3A9JSH8_9PROT|nr:sugar ABC transporter ATP-binding protein [Pseudoroseomonas wenyumeiae]RKK03668.1 sugar ABC transporter ATP-binding protein [Pseudoroseomonas wenyumeiae]RMI20190.1 ATP-binding cassette domain-containing protein [Pseudoroseomonas wenyumeiae]